MKCLVYDLCGYICQSIGYDRVEFRVLCNDEYMGGAAMFLGICILVTVSETSETLVM